MLCFSSVINRMRRLTDEKRIRQASRAPVSALIGVNGCRRSGRMAGQGKMAGWLVGWSGWLAGPAGGPESGATGTSHNKSAFTRRIFDL